AWAFAIITVVNSVMMVVGWDTPKSGTFAYVHLLSRLGIVAIVVALIDSDELLDNLRRWRGRGSRPDAPTADRDRIDRALALVRRRIARAPADTVVATFTLVTTLLCVVAIAVSPLRVPQGGVALDRNLLVLATSLVLFVGVLTWWYRSREGPTPARRHDLE
ncbi:MAG: hypothetical protein ACLFWR_14155, partial [Acidimicrobiales bacterium]